MKAILLNDREIIKITGKDKITFLQSLITNDVTKLSQENPLFACLLTAQGKFLADFFLYLKDDIIFVDINKELSTILLEKFDLYSLNAKIFFAKEKAKILLAPDYKITKNCFFSKKQNILAKDLRNDLLGTRIIEFTSEFEAEELDLAEYHKLRIKNLIIDGAYDLEIEKSYIFDFLYQDIPAISFDKGCYIGQEVINRVFRRGVIRKKPIKFQKSDISIKKNDEIITKDGKKAKICSFFIENNQAIGIALAKEPR